MTRRELSDLFLPSAEREALDRARVIMERVDRMAQPRPSAPHSGRGDDCRCPRSVEACFRRATVINPLSQPVCSVCHVGCGELRFGLPGALWVMCRVVTAHAPLRMEYQL